MQTQASFFKPCRAQHNSTAWCWRKVSPHLPPINGQKHATISRYKYILNKVCICVYIYIYTLQHIYIYICIVYVDNEKLINIYKTLQVCKYVYIYICMHIYIYIYIYVCIYIYIYVHVCDFFMRDHFISMYVYIYIYVHKLIWINDIGSAKTTRSFRRSFIHKRRTAPVFVPFRWWYRSSKYMRYTSP